MNKSKKGFTLIEMLVVIAIIAVLVSVIIPVVGESTIKAKAAADAANLRSVLGHMNSVLMMEEDNIGNAAAAYSAPDCNTFPNAELKVLYTYPGVIDVYFVDGTNYYGLEYLADIAEKGSTELAATAPTLGPNDTWYTVGG